MEIINKSGKAEVESEDSFYIVLSKEWDKWEGGDFYFVEGEVFSSKAEAVSLAEPGDAVAKVTLVAKIV